MNQNSSLTDSYKTLLEKEQEAQAALEEARSQTNSAGQGASDNEGSQLLAEKLAEAEAKILRLTEDTRLLFQKNFREVKQLKETIKKKETQIANLKSNGASGEATATSTVEATSTAPVRSTAEYKQLEDELQALNKVVKELREQETVYQESFSDYQQQLHSAKSEMEKHAEDSNEWRQKYEALTESTGTEITTMKADLEAAFETVSLFKEQKNEVEKMFDEHKAIQNEIEADLRRRLADAQGCEGPGAAEWRDQAEELEEKLDLAREELEMKTKENEELMEKIEEVANEFQSFQEQAELRATHLQDQIMAAGKNEEALRSEISEMKNLLNEVRASEEERLLWEKEKGKLQRQLVDVQREHRSTTQDLNVAVESLSKTEQMMERDTSNLRAKLEEAEAEIEKLRSEHSAMKSSNSDFKEKIERLCSDLNAARRDVSSTSSRLKKKEEETQRLRKECADADQLRSTQDQHREKMESTYRSKIARLEGLNNALSAELELKKKALIDSNDELAEAQHEANQEIRRAKRNMDLLRQQVAALEDKNHKLKMKSRVGQQTAEEGSPASDEQGAHLEKMKRQIREQTSRLEAQSKEMREMAEEREKLRQYVLMYKEKGDEKLQLVHDHMTKFKELATSREEIIRNIVTLFKTNERLINQSPGLDQFKFGFVDILQRF